MRKYISTGSIFFIPFQMFILTLNIIKDLNLLKYGLYFNDKLIGNHTFKFNKKDGFLYVTELEICCQ